jgi:hypothetical protein
MTIFQKLPEVKKTLSEIEKRLTKIEETIGSGRKEK